jgi:hypothetical protein
MTSVITHHIHPPIPQRQFDWVALFEGDEESQTHGYGASKLEALVDLADNTVEAMCERRDAMERQLLDVLDIEPPTWNQEADIERLYKTIETINGKILALDEAIALAEAEEAPR